MTPSAEESIQSSQDEPQPEGVCPMRWTCDTVTYYSLKSQCIAACAGAPCFLEHDCNGPCVCP